MFGLAIVSIGLLAFLSFVAYVLSRFMPPTGVVGSTLPNFDSTDRRNKMLRAESDQEFHDHG